MSGLTIDNPISMTDACAATNIIPGDALSLRGWTYAGSYQLRQNGSIVLPVIVRPYAGEHAAIDGMLELRSGCITVRDLEIFLSTIDREHTSISDSAIRPQSSFNSVINCYIHDHAQGILADSKQGQVLYGNVLLYCGNTGNQAHSIYTGNYSSVPYIIENNVSAFPFGYGIHCYGQSDIYAELLENLHIINNVSFMAGSINLITQGCILLGGAGYVRPHACLIKGNLTYFPDTSGNGLMLGFGSWGSDDCIVEDNILIGGACAFRAVNPRTLTFRNNIIYGAVSGIDPADYPDNEYHAFSIPDLVKVTPNTYESGRATVAIVNGSQANSVTVDLTAVTGLSIGDSVTVASVQDYLIDIVTLTLDANKSISVDMRAVSHTVAAPVGWTAPATTFPQFGCFIVRKVS